MITALFNLAGRHPFAVLTNAGGNFYNRTLAAYEARNDAHAADYAFDMAEGATANGLTTYTFDGVFGVGANASGLTALCIDRAALAAYNLNAESFWYEEGSVVGGALVTVGVAMPAPGKTTAYATALDGKGDPEPGAVVTFQMKTKGAAGYSWNRVPFTATSDAVGLVQASLAQATTYRARNGEGQWVEFTTGTADAYQLPELLSQDWDPRP